MIESEIDFESLDGFFLCDEASFFCGFCKQWNLMNIDCEIKFRFNEANLLILNDSFIEN